MKHLKGFNNINESNGLTYCKSCSFLLYPDDGDTLCKYCSVLDILGIDKNTDDGGDIYGQLKYLVKFNQTDKLTKYLKTDLKLTEEQYNKIINIL